MGSRNDLGACAAYGGMNRADSVSGLPGPSVGPVYLEGRLVLSLSFQGARGDERPCSDAHDALERFRLWDDLVEAWSGDDLEVLRFERADAVMRPGPPPVTLWEGMVDTRARVVPEPDLDEAGMMANCECDLCWKRVEEGAVPI